MMRVLMIVLITFQIDSFGSSFTRTYHIPPTCETFHYVGPGQIDIEQGASNSFEFNGPKAILDQFSIKITPSQLTIVGPNADTEPPEGKLIINRLSKLVIDENVKIDINSMQVEKLFIDSGPNGNPVIEGVLECQDLVLSLKGSSQTILQGQVNRQTLSIEKNAVYQAAELISNQSHIYLNHDARAFIYAKASLSAIIEGKGTLYYKGNPSITKQVRDTGSISLMEKE